MIRLKLKIIIFISFFLTYILYLQTNLLLFPSLLRLRPTDHPNSLRHKFFSSSSCLLFSLISSLFSLAISIFLKFSTSLHTVPISFLFDCLISSSVSFYLQLSSSELLYFPAFVSSSFPFYSPAFPCSFLTLDFPPTLIVFYCEHLSNKLVQKIAANLTSHSTTLPSHPYY